MGSCRHIGRAFRLHVLLRYESLEPVFVEPVGVFSVPHVIDEEG